MASSERVEDAPRSALNEKDFGRFQVEAVTKAEQDEGQPFVAGSAQQRNFTLFSIIGLAYACLNSYTAMASSISCESNPIDWSSSRD